MSVWVAGGQRNLSVIKVKVILMDGQGVFGAK